ncbi:phosphatidylserine decarboxylase [Sulfurimonas sp.]|jgi:phosphatidylserine decarboxylase|uniref:phosphatidylserine decarboxylase n=1 Tax=Sulfurimonas sp. TaxID=2022749 RepID=UPI0025D9EF3F|nr:phosphatidylserine decarboxylase [Sulfurimonas sp.]MCK9473184.1 phosphatidylserine decarboxylase [Sulfurimonas sp.]MDD3505290.1 phosphatidylserine decarboxylase [Sulfurimonas sp.]
MRSNLLPIAKEGWNYLAGAVASFLLFALFDLNLLQFLAFVTTLFFVFIFRNPERASMLYQENSVVSPVDGVVALIEELQNENSYAYKVEVQSSYLNVALLRAPFTSSLEKIELHKGARLSAIKSLSKDINENVKLTFIDAKTSNKIKIVHRLKQSIKGIDIDAIKGQNLLQGSRYGFVLNGVTELYLPHNFRINIGIGNELRASESLIGYFTTDKKKS